MTLAVNAEQDRTARGAIKHEAVITCSPSYLMMKSVCRFLHVEGFSGLWLLVLWNFSVFQCWHVAFSVWFLLLVLPVCLCWLSFAWTWKELEDWVCSVLPFFVLEWLYSFLFHWFLWFGNLEQHKQVSDGRLLESICIAEIKITMGVLSSVRVAGVLPAWKVAGSVPDHRGCSAAVVA